MMSQSEDNEVVIKEDDLVKGLEEEGGEKLDVDCKKKAGVLLSVKTIEEWAGDDVPEGVEEIENLSSSEYILSDIDSDECTEVADVFQEFLQQYLPDLSDSDPDESGAVGAVTELEDGWALGDKLVSTENTVVGNVEEEQGKTIGGTEIAKLPGWEEDPLKNDDSTNLSPPEIKKNNDVSIPMHDGKHECSNDSEPPLVTSLEDEKSNAKVPCQEVDAKVDDSVSVVTSQTNSGEEEAKLEVEPATIEAVDDANDTSNAKVETESPAQAEVKGEMEAIKDDTPVDEKLVEVECKSESESKKIEAKPAVLNVENDDSYMILDVADESDFDLKLDESVHEVEKVEVITNKNVEQKPDESFHEVEIVEEIDNKSEKELLSENEMLRNANAELSGRLTILEEFIELEFADKFEHFLKNRERLVNVMGLAGEQDEDQFAGKRSSRSQELVGLLKLVKNSQSSNQNATSSSTTAGTSKNSSSNHAHTGGKKTDSKTRSTKQLQAPEKVSAKAKTNGKSSDSPQKKLCRWCQSNSHLVRDCPFKNDQTSRYPKLLDISFDLGIGRKRKLPEENYSELNRLRKRKIARHVSRVRTSDQHKHGR